MQLFVKELFFQNLEWILQQQKIFIERSLPVKGKVQGWILQQHFQNKRVKVQNIILFKHTRSSKRKQIKNATSSSVLSKRLSWFESY
jgi:riboflavin synthase alpha subunit